MGAVLWDTLFQRPSPRTAGPREGSWACGHHCPPDTEEPARRALDAGVTRLTLPGQQPHLALPGCAGLADFAAGHLDL